MRFPVSYELTQTISIFLPSFPCGSSESHMWVETVFSFVFKWNFLLLQFETFQPLLRDARVAMLIQADSRSTGN